MSVSCGLVRTRSEQSTVRVGPVNSAASERWYGEMCTPIRMLSIQIRVISIGFSLSVHLCICTNWPWEAQLPTLTGQCGLTDERGIKGI